MFITFRDFGPLQLSSYDFNLVHNFTYGFCIYCELKEHCSFTMLAIHFNSTHLHMEYKSGRVSSSWSTSGSHRVNLVTNPVISHEWEKDREVFTTSGTYQRGIQDRSRKYIQDRNRNSRKGRQYNGHKKNHNKTSNGRHNTTQKTDD